jgi:hypothetical protein
MNLVARLARVSAQRQLYKHAKLDLQQLGVQQYAPLGPGRDFSEEEEKSISEEKTHWLPKIFQSYQTPIPELLASPGKQSVGAGLLGGGLGALLGGAAGASMQGGGQAGLPDGYRMAAGAAAGGLGLGGIMALLQYYTRKKKNEDIEELMRRLPEGAVRRDMLADPVYQKDLDRKSQAAERAADRQARRQDLMGGSR